MENDVNKQSKTSYILTTENLNMSGGDSGFPKGGTTTPEFRTKTFYLARFFGRKLHWTERGRIIFPYG